MSSRPIRVMIFDKSDIFRDFLLRNFSKIPSLEVIGIITSYEDANNKIAIFRPDVVLFSTNLFGPSDAKFIQNIQTTYLGTMVVVVDSYSRQQYLSSVKSASENPVGFNHILFDNGAFVKEYEGKILLAASVAAKKRQIFDSPAENKVPIRQSVECNVNRFFAKKFSPFTVIAIGASTGGTEATASLVKNLPADTPGIVVVQHMPPVFTELYAQRLDKECIMSAKEARNGDRVKAGQILVAPGDKHLRIVKDAQGYFVRCELGEKVSGHCPSVDVLFDSVASAAGANAVGVILTGMGADGAKGLLSMRNAGAHTIGQDEASCVVYGMPMVAFNSGAVASQLPLSAIANAILNAAK